MKLPNGSSNLSMLSEDVSLEDALKYPLDEWRIFLHPAQKEAVNWSPKTNLVITGGPGSGKSIVLLHRCRWLAEHDFAPIVVLSPNANLRGWLESQYSKLDENTKPRKVFFATTEALRGKCSVTGLKISSSALSPFVKTIPFRSPMIEHALRTTHLLIDEAQDLSVDAINYIERIAKKPEIHLTVALDPLQAIEFARGLAIRRVDLFRNFSSVDLTYSYRLSRSNGLLASTYALRTRSVLASFLSRIGHISSGTAPDSVRKTLDYHFGNELTATAFGFDGPSPSVEFVKGTDSQSIESAISFHIHRWTKVYPWQAIAIIWVGDEDTNVFRELSKSKELGQFVKHIQDVKGLEFFAGVIVGFEDALRAYTKTRDDPDSASRDDLLEITKGVLGLNRLYVGLTRFRNELVLLGTQKDDASIAFLRELAVGQLP